MANDVQLFSLHTTSFYYVWYNNQLFQQSRSWEAYISSASQEIPLNLWKRQVHLHIHNSPLIFTIPSQIILVHDLQTYLRMIQFILPFISRSFEWSLSFRFSHQTPTRISVFSHRCHGAAVA